MESEKEFGDCECLKTPRGDVEAIMGVAEELTGEVGEVNWGK